MEVSEIRTALKRAGRTQTELAAHLGIHKGSLSDLLSGKLRMRLETFRSIEAFLGQTSPSTGGSDRPNAVSLEEARKSGPAVRMSKEERERWLREIREIGEAGKGLPRVTELTDEEMLGYAES